eukprot:gene8771-14598_t
MDWLAADCPAPWRLKRCPGGSALELPLHTLRAVYVPGARRGDGLRALRAAAELDD